MAIKPDVESRALIAPERRAAELRRRREQRRAREDKLNTTLKRVAFSVPEVAALTGMAEATIWRAIKSGQLKAARFGGRVLVHQREIDRITGGE
jgi:excisionase family DNA binding protein